MSRMSKQAGMGGGGEGNAQLVWCVPVCEQENKKLDNCG
jgi:hypothetical protein